MNKITRIIYYTMVYYRIDTDRSSAHLKPKYVGKVEYKNFVLHDAFPNSNSPIKEADQKVLKYWVDSI